MRRRARVISMLVALVAPVLSASTVREVSTLSKRCRSGKSDACVKLAKVAVEDENPYVRVTAVELLDDQAMLRRIAVQDKDLDVRRVAMSKLTPESLAQIEAEATNARRAAVEALTDQPSLARIAARDRDASVRSAAVARITDQSVLAKVVMEDKDANVRSAAFSRLGALFKGNPSLVNAKDSHGLTPLHKAAVVGNRALAEALLANGSVVNAMANDGATALHLAALNGRMDVAKLLLAHQADVNAKSAGGLTPLHVALLKNHLDVAELLLSSKADINAKDNEGRSVIVYALSAPRYALGDGASLNVLIAAGASIGTTVLKNSRLLQWSSFGASLATQADINKLAAAPPRIGPPVARGMFDPSSFVASSFLVKGKGAITNPLFVAEDAVDINGKPIGTSKFTLIGGKGPLPERWIASMSGERGEQIYQFAGPMEIAELIRVGSQITLPAEQFVIVGGKYMRNGKGLLNVTPGVIVRKEGLEIQPGVEVLVDEWPAREVSAF